MLEQFRRFLVVGGSGGAADCCFAQRSENAGVGAGGAELRAVPIPWAERQTAGRDFMDHVFIERVASNQSKQLGVAERFALFFSACEPCTTAESKKDNQMTVDGG